MTKNYYLVLGIAADATQDEIKSAYREKAKRWHPDRSGEGSEPFLAIREAYEVLCDPAQRRAYDAERSRQETQAQPAPREVRPQPLRRARPPVEPLVPGPRASRARDTIMASPLEPLLAELFGRSPGGFETTPGTAAGRRTQELHFDVSLTHEEARRGGHLRVWLPVQATCPACEGWGRSGTFACPYCAGSGVVADEHPVYIALPPGLLDGSEGNVTLARSGRRTLTLVLHFRVDDQV
jgi:molecular chaperone DnaJ